MLPLCPHTHWSEAPCPLGPRYACLAGTVLSFRTSLWDSPSACSSAPGPGTAENEGTRLSPGAVTPVLELEEREEQSPNRVREPRQPPCGPPRP